MFTKKKNKKNDTVRQYLHEHVRQSTSEHVRQ